MAKDQAAQGLVLQVPQVAQRTVECHQRYNAACIYPGLIPNQQDNFSYQRPLPLRQAQAALLRRQRLLPALADTLDAEVPLTGAEQLFGERALIKQPAIGIGG